MAPDDAQGREPDGLAQLLHPEARLLARLAGVLRFDPAIYAEIQADIVAIPQSFAVVIATAVVAGLGQGLFAGLFWAIPLVIGNWLIVTALIWGVGLLVAGDAADYFRLLRCNGFAYAWFALLLASDLPFIGWLVGWSAVLLSLASLVIATRTVLDSST